jgi:hypothetical protein
MHSLTSERRRARRRRQIRRRRAAVFSFILLLVVLAVVVAYAWPSGTPAHVPQVTAASPVMQAEGVRHRVVVARIEAIDVLLPVAQQQTTAIAFHPVDNSNTVAFSPVGERVNDPSLANAVADVFRSGGGPSYYLMGGDGGDGSSSTSGLDIGAVPGEFVYSPVAGRVTAVKPYELLGRYPDCEVDIQLSNDPSLLLVVTHLARPRVKIGDDVVAAQTALGSLRGFPATMRQDLHQYTADAGDHVQMVVLRITPNLAGF